MAMRLYQGNPSLPLNTDDLSEPVLYAPFYTDSMEVAKAYYTDRLEVLEEKLGLLTIQEHPVQIARLAKQVMSIRSILRTLTR